MYGNNWENVTMEYAPDDMKKYLLILLHVMTYIVAI